MSRQRPNLSLPGATISSPTEAEQLRDLGVLLAAIARKAATRFEGDPAAIELVELSRKAEALIAEMVKERTK